MSETVEYVYEYWDCKKCSKKAIRGDKAVCPLCGATRDKDVVFYPLAGREEKITDQKEVERLGVAADWICPFCQTANNHHNKICSTCSAAYGQREAPPKRVEAKNAPARQEPDRQEKASSTQQRKQNTSTALESHSRPKEEPRPPVESPAYQRMLANRYERQHGKRFKQENHPVPRKIPKGILITLGVIGAFISSCVICYQTLFKPEPKEFTVISTSWSYEVALERYQTVTREAWQDSLPEGVQVLSRSQKIRRYDQIQTGTKTETYREKESYQSGTRNRTVTESVQVKTGEREECSTKYQSLGSGAAKKTTTCNKVPVYGSKMERRTVSEPVYSDRYVTKTREVPVYTSSPVYDTEVSYRTKDWVPVRTFSRKGTDFPILKPAVVKPPGTDYRLSEPVVIATAELQGSGNAADKKFVVTPNVKEAETYKRGARFLVPVDGSGNIFKEELKPAP